MSKVWLLMPFLLQGFATRGSWPVVFPSSGVSILVNTLKKAAKNMKKASSSSSLLSQIGSHSLYHSHANDQRKSPHSRDSPCDRRLRNCFAPSFAAFSQLSPSMHLMQNCKAWNRRQSFASSKLLLLLSLLKGSASCLST